MEDWKNVEWKVPTEREVLVVVNSNGKNKTITKKEKVFKSIKLGNASKEQLKTWLELCNNMVLNHNRHIEELLDLRRSIGLVIFVKQNKFEELSHIELLNEIQSLKEGAKYLNTKSLSDLNYNMLAIEDINVNDLDAFDNPNYSHVPKYLDIKKILQREAVYFTYDEINELKKEYGNNFFTKTCLEKLRFIKPLTVDKYGYSLASIKSLLSIAGKTDFKMMDNFQLVELYTNLIPHMMSYELELKDKWLKNKNRLEQAIKG